MNENLPAYVYFPIGWVAGRWRTELVFGIFARCLPGNAVSSGVTVFNLKTPPQIPVQAQEQ
jgi:hypothetical protein